MKDGSFLHYSQNFRKPLYKTKIPTCTTTEKIGFACYEIVIAWEGVLYAEYSTRGGVKRTIEEVIYLRTP